MWWEMYGDIDLYGGRITFFRDDSRDMFNVKYADGMTIDVGTPDEGESYIITAVSSDDVEGWNAPLSELEAASKDGIPEAVRSMIGKFRPKRDAVDKNALISEMLYIFFEHCKALGAKYKYSDINPILILCIELAKLLYKDKFGEKDAGVLMKGFAALSGHLSCAFTRYRTEDLVFESLTTPEPANRMLVVMHAILRNGSRALFRSEAALL